MPQKILLYRFPTEKMAGIHPHALEKNPPNLLVRDDITPTVEKLTEPGRSRLHFPVGLAQTPAPQVAF